ncbi:NADH dehydrogenase [Fistulifera solaris]|uniref:NADH:ubiquinone reductase (non-electrogenic) n=1 Tax=Fistulifera solaris TaxID=1519565 RepID=A0A1Z5KCJ9_FISSO|nr:NADH dehydrogenase [Fistulifera solaris]|eukprot:GAX23811.1 NADH dehydrogenase [Fistulifera solaris]
MIMTQSHWILCSSVLFALACTNDAFVPSLHTKSPLTGRVTLYSSGGGGGSAEEKLRQELKENNDAIEVKDEMQYAQADGAYLERLDSANESIEKDAVAQATADSSKTQQSVTIHSTSSSVLAQQIERMTKPRAYPLFLAEKAAEFVEATYKDVVHTFAAPDPYRVSNGNSQKERIVILGSGWGSISFLKDIDTDLYDVTVVSPRNHFVFTPMLAGASVGTVEFRSICEPIREINLKANYLEAIATDIDTEKKIVSCESVFCEGNSCAIEDFSIPYDRLIVTVGAQTNTFGIPGVRERCNFLKQIEDARRIRASIVNCFERANLPGLSDEEREQNLTFAVIGAGPTGIEFAAELRDFVEQDGPKYYPRLLKYVRIKIIEASSTVLAPFDKSLQEEAILQMNKSVLIKDPEVRNLLPERFKLTELLLDSSVKEVGEDTIFLNDGTKVPYGMAVWAAGNGPLPITLSLIDKMGEEQTKQQDVARGRLAIDPWMRVIGSEGQILAFGDCSCITAGQLPATAQVASQQGEYLANLMNRKYEFSPPRSEDGIFPPPKKDPVRTESSFSDAIASFAINNSEYAKPFQFLNLGILAYTGGGSALAQVTPAPNAESIKGTGKIGNAVWRSVYLSKQVSWRNRLLVLNDWTKRQLFGRDVTRI